MTAELEAFVKKQGCRNPRLLFEAFQDHWRAAPGQKGVKVDWPATLRNWARKHFHCPCEKPSTAGGARPSSQPPFVTARSLEEKWAKER